jgi:hypothetical protein
MKFKDLRQNLLSEAQLDHAQQISALVRKGLLPSKDLPTLKMALMRQQRVGGDIAKIPRSHREVLGKYNAALAGAVYGSTSAVQAAGRNLQKNSFDPERTDFILETSDAQHDPPMVMVLKRKGIRIFPDGKRVALYSNDQLGLTFTIPYVGGQVGNQNVMSGVQEDVEDYGDELLTENLKRLRFASQKKPVSINFKTGDNMHVDHLTARAITNLHKQLSPENKMTMMDKISTDPDSFKKVASFALRNGAYKEEEPKKK